MAPQVVASNSVHEIDAPWTPTADAPATPPPETPRTPPTPCLHTFRTNDGTLRGFLASMFLYSAGPFCCCTRQRRCMQCGATLDAENRAVERSYSGSDTDESHGSTIPRDAPAPSETTPMLRPAS
ncbi:hypothetical protein SPRG_20476 [Saprolegnia parasitica CBS 223.65]|uniref:LITAF domain-containing protein n=1 Tax=Saprolegnia parasitica (strain CBS 223.65) TaxID=695850 RepID=A0A067CIT1_SAPPC|nr:hypothetical protein SPRG_20476 [Saprolegnia parasitica CBS 223.65]KDO26672.1 hypothetical protein SPRG_20476 [Saprolegnia parasitica CBS 223.65]|eukprot:XP_012202570.1 hypothetical protein SPRG_20476 [Saprolegnia parasitica CBS 223.65]